MKYGGSSFIVPKPPGWKSRPEEQWQLYGWILNVCRNKHDFTQFLYVCCKKKKKNLPEELLQTILARQITLHKCMIIQALKTHSNYNYSSLLLDPQNII